MVDNATSGLSHERLTIHSHVHLELLPRADRQDRRVLVEGAVVLHEATVRGSSAVDSLVVLTRPVGLPAHFLTNLGREVRCRRFSVAGDLADLTARHTRQVTQGHLLVLIALRLCLVHPASARSILRSHVVLLVVVVAGEQSAQV